jgi:hypothetical protein
LVFIRTESTGCNGRNWPNILKFGHVARHPRWAIEQWF